MERKYGFNKDEMAEATARLAADMHEYTEYQTTQEAVMGSMARLRELCA